MNTNLSPKLEDTIATIATDLVWEATRASGWLPNCCIAACRVLQKVLRELGVVATPLVVETSVANRAYLDVARRIGGAPQTEAHAAAVARAGGWIVDIGMRPPGSRPSKNGWQGHLVLMTERLLLDPSLPQADRPAKDIAVNPLVMPHGGQFPEIPLFVELNDCAAVIVARPGDRSYMPAPDWRFSKHQRVLAASVVAAVRQVDEAVAGSSFAAAGAMTHAPVDARTSRSATSIRCLT